MLPKLNSAATLMQRTTSSLITKAADTVASLLALEQVHTCLRATIEPVSWRYTRQRNDTRKSQFTASANVASSGRDHPHHRRLLHQRDLRRCHPWAVEVIIPFRSIGRSRVASLQPSSCL